MEFLGQSINFSGFYIFSIAEMRFHALLKDIIS